MIEWYIGRPVDWSAEPIHQSASFPIYQCTSTAALRREVEEAFKRLMEGQPRGRLAAQMAARLPAKCPNCGAPVKPKEVSWAGPATAECLYCGGAMKPE